MEILSVLSFEYSTTNDIFCISSYLKFINVLISMVINVLLNNSDRMHFSFHIKNADKSNHRTNK